MDETLIHAKFHTETVEQIEEARLGFLPAENEGDCK